MNERSATVSWVLTYIAAILAANLLTNSLGMVPVGFGLVVTAGTFAAGFALLARDFVHRVGGVRLVFGCIGVGAVLSWLTTTPSLALASTIAFAGAELVDLAVFAPLRRKGFIRAAVASNVVSAPIDTVLFLSIAGFPVTLVTVGGQFVGKVLWATLVPVALYVAGRYALSRNPVHPSSA